MHLSLLSGASLSDLFDDSAAPVRTTAPRQHLDGLLRGLCVGVALLLPVGLSFAADAFGHERPVASLAGRP